MANRNDGDQANADKEEKHLQTETAERREQ
jgi:hypothetical protein